MTEEGKLKVGSMRECFNQCLEEVIYRNRQRGHANEIISKLKGILRDISLYSKEAREEHNKVVEVLGSQLSPLMHEMFKVDENKK